MTSKQLRIYLTKCKINATRENRREPRRDGNREILLRSDAAESLFEEVTVEPSLEE